ncbi:MAG TPA: M67 family metallopeptidase [Terriglobales bacterium]
MSLMISKVEFEKLRRHGEETYPHECCGVLVGEIDEDGNKHASAAVRCTNIRTDSPQNRYSIDPRELLRIQKEALAQGVDMIGFYHSHPDHPARWSQTDLAEAHWTGCSYVITSVEQGRAAITNSFILTGSDDSKDLQDEEILIEEETNSAGAA